MIVHIIEESFECLNSSVTNREKRVALGGCVDIMDSRFKEILFFLLFADSVVARQIIWN